MAVPFLLWKLLPPETQQQAIRNACGDPICGNLRGTGGDTNVPKVFDISKLKEDKNNGTKNDGIPWQYSNPADRLSNKAGKEEAFSNSENEKTPNEDPDEMIEYELWTKLMNTVKDMTVKALYENFGGDRMIKMSAAKTDADVDDVQAYTDFYNVIARLVKGNNINISALGNGADTCVVGTGWTVLIKTT